MDRKQAIRNLIHHMIHKPDHGIKSFSNNPGRFHFSKDGKNVFVDEFSVSTWEILEALGVEGE